MSAFSLVEIVVAAAILVVVLGVLMLALSTGGTTVSRGVGTLDTVATTGLALERLRHDLRLLAAPLLPVEGAGTREVVVTVPRIDAVDASQETVRISRVTYRFRRVNGKRAELVREEAGRRSVFAFDRDVVFTAGPATAAIQSEGSCDVSFAFPPSKERPDSRPPVATTIVALNPIPGSSGPLASSGSSSSLVVPSVARPFPVDPGQIVEGLDDLFPPDAMPRPARR